MFRWLLVGLVASVVLTGLSGCKKDDAETPTSSKAGRPFMKPGQGQ